MFEKKGIGKRIIQEFLFRSAILSPILGYAVDRTGRNLYWLMGSITTTIIAHALLAFLFVHPVVPLTLMGISYSILAASLWPMVAFLVPKKMLGTAYGFMQSIQNLGLAVMYVFYLSKKNTFFLLFVLQEYIHRFNSR
jgi:MFS family permease